MWGRGKYGILGLVFCVRLEDQVRLSKVKLSGFKSFVDPTTFVLTGHLTGIVGPNGCGKSNIIDAVRWVMGESSAKQLRGESMSDVIFNGSEHRKPAGMASIELIFNNEEGKLGGEWADFNEISIRRVLDREGKSQYFFNGARCRRRDITDIFLGTGLGPRSYAIIEQGMISRIVESKPDELRLFFEEAANISKYKERRRETELRIGHTRDNLARLTDIRTELGKQLTRLERQAATARRYQALKREERLLDYWRLHQEREAVASALQNLAKAHESESEQFQSVVAHFNQLTVSLFDKKQAFEALEQQMGATNETLYQYKQQVDRLQHELTMLSELKYRDAQTLAEWNQNSTRLEEEIASLQLALESLQSLFEEENLLFMSSEEQVSEKEAEFERLEAAAEKESEAYQNFVREMSRIEQKLSLDQHTVRHQTERLTAIERELTALEKERKDLPEVEETSEAMLLEEERILLEERMLDLQGEKQSLAAELTHLQQSLNDLERTLRTQNAEKNQRAGEVSTLKTLLLAAQEQAAEAPLFEQITVKEGWDGALDHLLEHWLKVSTEQPPHAEASYVLGRLPFEFTPAHLGFYIETDLSLGALLSHVYVEESAESESFKARLSNLALHEMIVTKNGDIYGADWKRAYSKRERGGLLAQQNALEIAETRLLELESTLLVLEESRSVELSKIEQLRREIDTLSKTIEATKQQQFELEKKLSLALQAESHQQASERRLSERIAQLTQDKQLAETILEETEATIVESQILYESAEEELSDLEKRVAESAEKLSQEKQILETMRAHWMEKQRRVDQLQHELKSHSEAKNRAEGELERLKERMESADITTDYDDKIAEITESLLLAEETLQVNTEESAELKAAYEAARSEIKQLEEEKAQQEKAMHGLKDAIQAFAVKEAELAAQQRHLESSWNDIVTDVTQDEIQESAASLGEQPTEELHLGLQTVREKLSKIGAVNLVAIEESEELRERKEYLDEQDEDLNKALATLERAMAEIDNETRERFMETFNKVNEDFSKLFPRLFGGGKAYLELTENDALTSGVNIIAHPPGKKPGTIHLLSGGEKALTAMALVFSIFNLNPAPFCMLDEVDAPLDEANVGRLGELIGEMSEKVQFIFITHNKATMTISDALIGVTMVEPGVSRLVSVDLEEAMAFSE